MFTDLLTYAKRHPKINCYAFVDDFRSAVDTDNLSTFNMPKPYKAYLDGHFWAKDFELAGARPDMMRKDYPALMVESKRYTITDRFNVPDYCERGNELAGFTGRIERKHVIFPTILMQQDCYDVAIQQLYTLMDELVYYLANFEHALVWNRQGEIYQFFTGVDNLYGVSVEYEGMECKDLDVTFEDLGFTPKGIVKPK